MDICYCHPHPNGETKADTKVVFVWAIWVMTVSLESFEAVLVIETTGNTVCSLSQSIIVHMAFNRHGVQSEKLTHFQYMTSTVKLLQSFMLSVFVKSVPEHFIIALLVPYARIETSVVRKCYVSICSIHTDSDLYCHQDQLSLSAMHCLMC